MTKRPGRLFIDYLRNQRGTTGRSDSPRARGLVFVSAFIYWTRHRAVRLGLVVSQFREHDGRERREIVRRLFSCSAADSPRPFKIVGFRGASQSRPSRT